MYSELSVHVKEYQNVEIFEALHYGSYHIAVLARKTPNIIGSRHTFIFVIENVSSHFCLLLLEYEL